MAPSETSALVKEEKQEQPQVYEGLLGTPRNADGQPVTSDAERYHLGGVGYATLGRSASVLLTFCIELIPALLIIEGSEVLQTIEEVDAAKASVFAGFIAVVSAVSGNVGLQSSILLTRAISHGYVDANSWPKALVKEMKVAVVMGVTMGVITAVVSGIWAESRKIGMCIGFAQMCAIICAGLTGTFSPLLFHLVLKRDPGMWAGPMECAVQDIIGTGALFWMSVYLMQASWFRHG